MAHRKLTAAFDRTVVTAGLATALLATPLALPALAQLQPPGADPIEDAVTDGTEATVNSCEDLTSDAELPTLPAEPVDPAEAEALREACEEAAEAGETTADVVTGPVQDAAPPPSAEAPAPATAAPADDGVQAAGGGVTPIQNVDRMTGGDNAPVYTEDGPALRGATGLRSSSAPTLQPVLAPIVSAPFVYELPQVAGQLWQGMTRSTVTTTGAAHSQGEETSTGWLVLVAAGFLSLVGGSYVVGARTQATETATAA